MEQSDRERELLFPSQRKRGNTRVARVGKRQALRDASHPLADLRVGQPVDAAVQRDVLTDRQVFVQRKPLAHVADAAPDLLGLRHHVESRDGRPTRRWSQQSDQHPDRSCFTCAVRAEESKHLAWIHLEGDLVHCRERPKPLGEILHLDRVSHAAASRDSPMSAMNVSSIPGSIRVTTASSKPRD